MPAVAAEERDGQAELERRSRRRHAARGRRADAACGPTRGVSAVAVRAVECMAARLRRDRSSAASGIRVILAARDAAVRPIASHPRGRRLPAIRGVGCRDERLRGRRRVVRARRGRRRRDRRPSSRTSFLVAGPEQHDVVDVSLLTASALPLVVWRRAPFAVSLVSAAVTIALAVLDMPHLGLADARRRVRRRAVAPVRGPQGDAARCSSSGCPSYRS